ncbi:efflux RND transporter permease subunit [Desulfosporosinus sp. FKB]|uniref:efflux RND transporter permease subunit n=1 Tax=Desulfosporosinus sp. FKB TaxID=1969835 RepID=UPI000B4990D5|nr:efflux RND transporter permease subunit [Desulfosporosinus sp. FKB]
MFLANLSIKRPVFAVVVIIALLAVGAVSYLGLPIDQYPQTDIPMVSISITESGVSAEQLESNVTKKVEEAVGQISGVKHITSTINEGRSQTTIEFNSGKSIDVAAQDVKDKISGIRGSLPQDIDEPVIQKFDMNSQPILSLVVTGPLPNRDLSQIVDDITKQLNTVNGVGSITSYGTQTREIHIKLDNQKMTALNLTASQVTASLGKDNVDMSTGSLSNGDKEVTLRTTSPIKEVDDFRNVLVANRNGTEIRIGDIAQVEDGIEDRDSLSYYKGAEAIGIDIVKQSGENTTQVASDLKKEISKLQGSVPKGVKIEIVDDNSLTIQDSVNEVKKTIIEGCALAIIVVFLFLRNWGSTAISAVALPTSIITTFAAMRIMNFSLNTMSLMGLSLAVGLLIDDAIVVIENIVRHLKMGKSPIQAAKDGTSEIGLAVMATTFTIVSVFLPISLVTGMIGAYFKQFGLTVAASVLVSLFVSFTLVPMLSSKYLNEGAPQNKKPGPLGRFLLWFNESFEKLAGVYSRILKVALRHRGKTIIIAFALFFASLTLLSGLGMSLMESTDNGKVTIEADLDGGTTLDGADKTYKEMEAILNKNSELQYLYTTVTSSKIDITAKFPDKNHRKTNESLSSIGNQIRTELNKIPGISLSITAGSSVMSGKDVQLHFKGNDFNQLLAYSQKAEKILKETPGAVDVSMDYQAGKPEAKIDVDRDRAADLGVSPSDVANTLQTLFNGTVATHYETQKDRYNVKVLLQDNQRKDLDNLKDIYVQGTNGLVPLDQVTKTVFSTGSTTINRYDKEREIELSANLVGVSTGTFNTQFNNALNSKVKMPVGVSQSAAGSQEMMAESLSGLVTALLMGILFIFLILAAQFESFMDPFAILFSLPFAIIGAILGLYLSHSNLSMMAFIGVIMLMGLVTKNAILLIDFTKQSRAAGTERNEAILQAGTTRLRPIIMTTLAMIFGMLPTAISTGTGSESRAPMAYTIIGGLITSTFLTLVVVPVVYTLLDDLKGKFMRKKRSVAVTEDLLSN